MSDPPTVDTNRRRPTVWDHVGGTSGLVQSAMPSLAFVSAHAVAGIGTAIAVAIATATVVLVVRLLRRQTVRPALGGMVGVVVSSAIAYRTGTRATSSSRTSGATPSPRWSRRCRS